MYLTHDDLIKLGEFLGYSDIKEGLCYGFSGVWAQAVLFEEEKKFYDRLNLIISNKGFNLVNLSKHPNEMTAESKNLLKNRPTYALFDDKMYYIEHDKISLLEFQPSDRCKHIFNSLDIDIPIDATKEQLEKIQLFTSNNYYNNDFQFLKDKIEGIKNRLKEDAKKNSEDRPLLNEEEWMLLELLSFYDDITLYLNLGAHREVFNTSYTPSQQDVEQIYSFAKPGNESKDINISFALDKSSAFDKATITDYFNDLEVILATRSDPTPIFLSSFSHTVSLKYDKNKECWIYIDTNDLEQFTDDPNKCQPLELNTDELSDRIFTSLADSSLDFAVFATTILTGKPDPQFNDLLKLFDSCYPVQEAHAFKFDANRVGLLYVACQNGHLETVKELLKYNPKIDLPKSSGETPFYIACQNGHLETVKELLKYKPDINLALPTGESPLFIAFQMGHLEIVNELLKHHADINKATCENITPLFIACKEGNLNVVQALLKHRPMTNISEECIELNMACMFGHPEIVNELLADPGVHPTDNQFTLAFNLACQYGQLSIVKKLLDYRSYSNLTMPDSDDGTTALYNACRDGKYGVIEFLVNHADFKDIDPIGPEGETPLLAASLLPNDENTAKIVHLLLHKGASLSYQNEAGQTALDVALATRNTVAVKALVQAVIDRKQKLEEVVSTMSPQRALALIKTHGEPTQVKTLGVEVNSTHNISRWSLFHSTKAVNKDSAPENSDTSEFDFAEKNSL